MGCGTENRSLTFRAWRVKGLGASAAGGGERSALFVSLDDIGRIGGGGGERMRNSRRRGLVASRAIRCSTTQNYSEAEPRVSLGWSSAAPPYLALAGGGPSVERSDNVTRSPGADRTRFSAKLWRIGSGARSGNGGTESLRRTINGLILHEATSACQCGHHFLGAMHEADGLRCPRNVLCISMCTQGQVG